MGADEAGTLRRLNQHRSELIDPLIEKHGGRIVKTTGDGLLLEFPSVVAAVVCSIAVQEGMVERNSGIAGNEAIRFRVGVHLGDVIVEADDIFGDGVNIASRVEGLSDVGGVAVTDDAYRQVRDRLKCEWRDGGEHEVKNIIRPIQVWHWALDNIPAVAVTAASTEPLPLPDKPSIAVLPFANMSGDPEQEYFADGMTEDLITDLSKLASLNVIARNSSFVFKGRRVDIRDVAKQLGVRNILEGSVRKLGTRVRINAQLLDGASGNHIWADRYDGDLDDIFDLHDGILAKIVSALEINLTGRGSHKPGRRATEDVDAYDLFLRGRTRYHSFTPAALMEAHSLFEEVIETDEKFAAPYVLISMIQFAGWLFMWPEFSNDVADALRYAEKAVEIDDNSGRAYANLGWIQLWAGVHENSLANFERGVALDPANAENHAYYAETLNYLGEPDQALERIQKAIEYDPMLPPNCLFHMGHSYYLLGRYDEAVETISSALKMVPGFPPGHLVLAAVFVELGNVAAAANEIEILGQIAPLYTQKEIARLYPHNPPAVKQRLLAALGEAGLTE
jgi:TolB-like protein